MSKMRISSEFVFAIGSKAKEEGPGDWVFLQILQYLRLIHFVRTGFRSEGIASSCRFCQQPVAL